MSHLTASGEDMVQCPYNKAHRLLRKHFQSHLVKCRRSHPDVEFMTCPFNVGHLVSEQEYKHHVSNCPDKVLIVNYKYNMQVTKKEKIEPSVPEKVQCDDNWDDVDVKTYNPEVYASTAAIIRRANVGLPSERKAFRRSERKRHHEVDVDDDESN